MSVTDLDLDPDFEKHCELKCPHFYSPAGGQSPPTGLSQDCFGSRACIYIYVCMLWISSLLVVYDAIDNASSSRATRTEN